jgi:hypothetical protein
MSQEIILNAMVMDRNDSTGALSPAASEQGARLRRDSDGNVDLLLVNQDGSLDSHRLFGEYAEEYDSAGSFQVFPVDLTLGASAGAADPDTDFLAPIMGNVLGADLTKAGNYIAGLIGAYSITGVRGSSYPLAAVMGIVMDGADDLDAAVLAVLDGDSGASTKARAAFAVMNNNSTASNKFSFGLDLASDARDGYLAVAYATADIRLAKKNVIISGSGAPSAGAGVAAPVGSLFVRSDPADADTVLYVKHGAMDTAWTPLTST